MRYWRRERRRAGTEKMSRKGKEERENQGEKRRINGILGGENWHKSVFKLGDWHGGKRKKEREWNGREQEGSLEGRLREGKKGKRQFWAGPERPPPTSTQPHLQHTSIAHPKFPRQQHDNPSTWAPHRLRSLIYLHLPYLPVSTSTHLFNLKILQDWRRRTWRCMTAHVNKRSHESFV